MQLIVVSKIICIIATFITQIYFSFLEQQSAQIEINYLSKAYLREIIDNQDKICDQNFEILKVEYMTKPVCDCIQYNQTIFIGNSCKQSDLLNCDLISPIGRYNISTFTFDQNWYGKLVYICYKMDNIKFNIDSIYDKCSIIKKNQKNYKQECMKNLKQLQFHEGQNNQEIQLNYISISLSTDTYLKSINLTTSNNNNSLFQLTEQSTNYKTNFMMNASQLTYINQINIQSQTIQYLMNSQSLNLTLIEQDSSILDGIEQILYFTYQFMNLPITPLIYLNIFLILLNFRFINILFKIAENLLIILSFALCYLKNYTFHNYIDYYINPFIDGRIDTEIQKDLCFIYIIFLMLIISIKYQIKMVLSIRFLNFQWIFRYLCCIQNN